MVIKEFFARFGFEIDGKGFSKFQASLVTLNQGVQLVGAGIRAARGAFDSLVTDQIRAAEAVKATSDQLGISAEALQSLQFAADQSDSSVDALNTGLKFLSKNISDAASGSKELQSGFAGIGVNADSLRAEPLEKAFARVADGFARLKDPAQRTALAMQLFGRSGAELIPFLTQGQAGIAKLAARFEDLGGGLTGSDLQALTGLGDMFAELSVVFGRVKAIAATALVPAIRGIVGQLTAFVVANKKLIGQKIAETFSVVADAIARTGKALFTLGNFVNQNRAFFAALAVGIGVVFAPILTFLALLLLLIDDLDTFQSGGDSLFGRVQKWADGLAQTFDGSIFEGLLLALRDTMQILKDDGLGDVVGAWTMALVDGIKEWTRLIADFAKDILDPFEGNDFAGKIGGGVFDAIDALVNPKVEPGAFVSRKQFDALGFAAQVKAGATTVNNSVVVNIPPGTDLPGGAQNILDHIQRELDNQYRKTMPAITRVR